MTTKRNKFREELFLIMKVLAVDTDTEVDYVWAWIKFDRCIDDVGPAVKAKVLTAKEGQLIKNVQKAYRNVTKLHLIDQVFTNELYANDDIWKEMREAARVAATALEH